MHPGPTTFAPKASLLTLLALSLLPVLGQETQELPTYGNEPEELPVYGNQPDAFEDLGSPGYYPTGQELGLLGGPYEEMYRRSRGGISHGGPDAGSLTASGIWHQDEEPTESFYERHDQFFGALDSFLGPLAPSEPLMWETGPQSRDYIYGYYDLGFLLNRDFNPDLATVKLGPVYLDLIRASASLLYSDYSGTPALNNDDGWLSILSMDFRGGAQITNNLFLTLSGSVYYLPGENRFGFYLGGGNASYFRIGYKGAIEDWEYQVYNTFQVIHRLADMFDDLEVSEIDVAGRYRFGRYDTRYSNDYFDPDGLLFTNRFGTAFTGPMGELINAYLSLERRDHWQTLDFEDHRYADEFRLRLDYLGFSWPVIPYFAYDLTGADGWDRIYERFMFGARARIGQNTRLDGSLGYFRSHGDFRDSSRPIGRLGIVQELTAKTSHSLYAGAQYLNLDDGEDVFANFIRYTLIHRFSQRLRGAAFVQVSDVDNLDGLEQDRNGWSAGAQMTAALSDYTFCRMSLNYDEFDSGLGGALDRNQWIYRAMIRQRLLPYLYGGFIYQYTDVSSTGLQNFDEHLYQLSLDYLF